MASNEKRLSGDPSLFATDAPAANTAAVATFAATPGQRNSVIAFGMSVNGTTPAVARATLAFTKNGVVTTLGFRLPAAQLAPIIVTFGSHPIEGDPNTAITLTLPAMGASQTGEVWLKGYRQA